MIRHVVWDWNGTLFDDGRLSWAITAEMLRERMGLELPYETYQSRMGHPYEEAYRSIGFSYEKESYAHLASVWAREYEKRWRQCSLRPGAWELIRMLRERGITQSVLTASRQDLAQMQMDCLGLTSFFICVQGVSDDLAAGKGHLARTHAQRLGLVAEGTLLVGDSAHDALTAAEIGCRCVLVCGGHMDEKRLRASGERVVSDLEALKIDLERELQ